MRIATFNLEDFGNARKGNAVFEERAAVLRPQLDRFKADVLCLQEVNAIKVGGTRRPIDLERLLEATSYARHALTISQGPSGDGPADVHNLAVLSRLPIVEEHLIWHSLVEPLHFSSHSAVPPDAIPTRSHGIGRCSISSLLFQAVATCIYATCIFALPSPWPSRGRSPDHMPGWCGAISTAQIARLSSVFSCMHAILPCSPYEK